MFSSQDMSRSVARIVQKYDGGSPKGRFADQDYFGDAAGEALGLARRPGIRKSFPGAFLEVYIACSALLLLQPLPIWRRADFALVGMRAGCLSTGLPPASVLRVADPNAGPQSPPRLARARERPATVPVRPPGSFGPGFHPQAPRVGVSAD